MQLAEFISKSESYEKLLNKGRNIVLETLKNKNYMQEKFGKKFFIKSDTIEFLFHKDLLQNVLWVPEESPSMDYLKALLSENKMSYAINTRYTIEGQIAIQSNNSMFFIVDDVTQKVDKAMVTLSISCG